MRGGEVGAGRREGLGWWRHTRGMHGDGPAQGLGAKGTRRAHVEHEAHGRDAGGVEAQRLVKRRRGLPSQREGMRCWGRGGSREAGGPVLGWWRHDKRHARGKVPTQGLGAKGTRGEARRAYLEHAVHGREAGGVEAQRLVEGRRVLPSRREGMRCWEERWEPRGGRACAGVWWRHDKRHARGKGPAQGLGANGHARSARRTCSAWS